MLHPHRGLCEVAGGKMITGPQETEPVNPKLKKLMKELGEAINSSLAESEDIAATIQKIKSEGYDVFLVVEATIGFNKREEEHEERTAVVANRAEPEFKVDAQDLRFLRSMKIKLD